MDSHLLFHSSPDGDQDEKEDESEEIEQGKEVGAGGDENPRKFHNWRDRGAAQMILPLIIEHPKVRSLKKGAKDYFQIVPR